MNEKRNEKKYKVSEEKHPVICPSELLYVSLLIFSFGLSTPWSIGEVSFSF